MKITKINNINDLNNYLIYLNDLTKLNKIELENNLKLRNQRINHILTEQSKQREEIWKKIEKRNKDIDRLLG